MSDARTKDEGVAIKCPKHNVPMDIETDCRVCRGDGMIEDDEGGVTDWVRCWSCRGSGRGLDDCEYCLQEDEDDI